MSDIEGNRRKIDDLNMKNAILIETLLSLIPDKKEENNKDIYQGRSSYGYGNDSEDIAELLKGFKYKPEDKEKILKYYK